jgi:hypothetical protein
MRRHSISYHFYQSSSYSFCNHHHPHPTSPPHSLYAAAGEERLRHDLLTRAEATSARKTFAETKQETATVRPYTSCYT